MLELFEVAAGTVAGTEHTSSGRNNQDGFACRWSQNALVGVVCDGCTAAPHSEVGAKTGARLVAEQLHGAMERSSDAEGRDRIGGLLEETRQQVVAALHTLGLAMGPGLPAVASEYFLFTVVGFAIGPRSSFTFSIGDGLLAVNGETLRIGPFPGNEPPYLAYGTLVASSLESTNPELLRFQVHHILPTENLESVMVGSDGLEQALLAETRLLPGLAEPFGPLSQFWTEDRYFRNPVAVQRRLAQANRCVSRVDWASGTRTESPGLLPDDTTLVIARRRPGTTGGAAS
jgi:hypothetical protein